jgi:transposase, IS5 family
LRGWAFIAHVAALPGNPYEAHTLATVVPAIEQQIGVSLTRIITDRRYRGHNVPPGQRCSVYISGQTRSVTTVIRRELRRRAAVAGHWSSESRTPDGTQLPRRARQRCRQRHLAALGYNFRRLLAWLAVLLVFFSISTASAQKRGPPLQQSVRPGVFHGQLMYPLL